MILIVRISIEGEPKKTWAAITARKDALQSALQKKGRLLYLTKRTGFNEASLFVHAHDFDSVVELVTGHLNSIEGVSAISIIHLFRPRFFPIPKDTYDLKHFVVSIKANPASLKEVYRKLLNPNVPDGLRKVYYGFTFQHYDENLQYALLADDEETLQKYVAEKINTIDGILATDVQQTEKTKPFITYKEWQDYTSECDTIPAWHYYMENHFAFAE